MPQWMQQASWWRIRWYLALRKKWDVADPCSEYAAWLVATLEALWAAMPTLDKVLVEEALEAT